MLSFNKFLTKSALTFNKAVNARAHTKITRPLTSGPLMPMGFRAAAFSTLEDRNHSGLKPNEFDYYFESKIDHGHYPHDYMSYMKVLGQDYDTNSE